jgi:hypothetical protein
MDLVSGRERALIRLEPSFGQKPVGRWEVFLDVAHYKMGEYDMCLRTKSQYN